MRSSRCPCRHFASSGRWLNAGVGHHKEVLMRWSPKNAQRIKAEWLTLLKDVPTYGSGQGIFYTWCDSRHGSRVKIGSSNRKVPSDRIWEQTYLHKPKVLFMIYTDFPAKLENAM